MSNKWHAAWRWDGRKFATIYHVNKTMDGKGPHLGVSAGSCSQPCICDGYEVCVHHSDRGSRTPMRPILSCESRDEAVKVARLLRRCCEAWMAEGVVRLENYGEIDRRIREVAKRLGYRKDHRSVWHRSGNWLDTPSTTEGKTWRETGRYEDAVSVWSAAEPVSAAPVQGWAHVILGYPVE
jgi:hypothetical protein